MTDAADNLAKRQAFRIHAGRQWAKTPRGKLICPTCGATGWPNGTWIDRHDEHRVMACGKWVPSDWRNRHWAQCATCQAVGA